MKIEDLAPAIALNDAEMSTTTGGTSYADLLVDYRLRTPMRTIEPVRVDAMFVHPGAPRDISTGLVCGFADF